MILKCTYCNGKMRVDEKSIPEGKWVKVKCPHCNGIGLAGAQPPPEGAIPGHSLPSPSAGAPEVASTPRIPPSDTQLPYLPRQEEPSVPQDAFRGFRFPAEKASAEISQSEGKKTRRFRALAWIAASLGVILLFALIVNLVLPGPLK
jgi:predicted Zn finger-like uncharacterized protein